MTAVPFLRRVPAATLAQLAAHAVLHRVPAGAVLFDHAEQAAFAQILLSGSIELLGVRGEQETLIELLQPVDMVIPAAVLSRRAYLMRARVHEEALLLLISADTFRHAMSGEPALCQAVLGVLAAQFRRQVRQNKNVRLRSAEERVGCYVAGLLPHDADGQTEIRLPLGKALIASQLGMTRETFSRTLSALKRQGVQVQGETLRVASAAALRAAFPLDPLIDGAEPPESVM
jgi:CRP/FNR family transcriptional activator FtrB